MNARRILGATLVIAIVVASVGLVGKPSLALPTFAKAYGMNCDVCHTTVPQLNSYGRYVQRTGYAALDRGVVGQQLPLTLAESANSDSRSTTDPSKIEFGNTALHAAGFLGRDLTFHFHQWFAQGNQSGGLDTLQFTYSDLLKHNGHLFVGKLSALPVPGPFSNGSDLSPFSTAELTVGEHMYAFDMMRWGAAFSYVRPTFYAETAWFGSDADLNGATDFKNDTDKTFQWIVASAGPDKPVEIGAYGAIGTLPLAEGGVDRYNATGVYVQHDPQPGKLPGLLAVYQSAYDGNPGSPMGMSGSMMPSLPARSHAWTTEVYEPLFGDRATIGLRDEITDDGLGTTVHSGNIDLGVQPFDRYPYVHAYFESGLTPNTGPAWRWMLWWTTPVGSQP